jgi:hypothetical protein
VTLEAVVASNVTFVSVDVNRISIGAEAINAEVVGMVVVARMRASGLGFLTAGQWSRKATADRPHTANAFRDFAVKFLHAANVTVAVVLNQAFRDALGIRADFLPADERRHLHGGKTVPGMVLIRRSGRKFAKAERIGVLSIPHERSPLIYIQAIEGQGRAFVLSTMLGEPVMRGLMMTVSNLVANAFIPVALPVALRRLSEVDPDPVDFGHIAPDDAGYKAAMAELKQVVARQYARLIIV